jgi:hypothetical protein
MHSGAIGCNWVLEVQNDNHPMSKSYTPRYTGTEYAMRSQQPEMLSLQRLDAYSPKRCRSLLFIDFGGGVAGAIGCNWVQMGAIDKNAQDDEIRRNT